MENKVIEVFDYMGEKLGIAIDWTAENVMPQVMEFLGRYQIFSIVNCVVWFVVYISLIIACVIVLKKMYKGIATQDHDNIWYDIHWSTDAFITILVTIIGIVCIVLFGVNALEEVFDVTKWALVPEMQFFEVFSEYLNNIK